jgi:hypothetical protein
VWKEKERKEANLARMESSGGKGSTSKKRQKRRYAWIWHLRLDHVPLAHDKLFRKANLDSTAPSLGEEGTGLSLTIKDFLKETACFDQKFTQAEIVQGNDDAVFWGGHPGPFWREKKEEKT